MAKRPDNLMSIKKTADLIKEVEQIGYTQSSIKKGGSHIVLQKPGSPSLSIPDKREIAPGTLRGILKISGLYENKGSKK